MIRRNMVVLTGRATKKPELKETGSSKVCTIRMVSNKRIKQRDGEYKEKPMYIDAECWGKRAEYAVNNIDRGTVLAVVGELEQDEWGEGENRKSKHKIYVSFDLQVDRFANKGADGGGQRQTAGAGAGNSGGNSSGGGGSDLPF